MTTIDEKYPLEPAPDEWTDQWLRLDGPNALRGRDHRLEVAERFLDDYAVIKPSENWTLIAPVGWGEMLEVARLRGCKAFGVQNKPMDNWEAVRYQLWWQRQDLKTFFTAGLEFLRHHIGITCDCIVLVNMKDILLPHIEGGVNWRLTDRMCRTDVTRTLKGCWRILAPGGCLLMGWPPFVNAEAMNNFVSAEAASVGFVKERERNLVTVWGKPGGPATPAPEVALHDSSPRSPSGDTTLPPTGTTESDSELTQGPLERPAEEARKTDPPSGEEARPRPTPLGSRRGRKRDSDESNIPSPPTPHGE